MVSNDRFIPHASFYVYIQLIIIHAWFQMTNSFRTHRTYALPAIHSCVCAYLHMHMANARPISNYYNTYWYLNTWVVPRYLSDVGKVAMG